MITLFFGLLMGLCYTIIWCVQALIFAIVGKLIKPKQPDTEDVWIYTELEAYAHQIDSERAIIKQLERTVKHLKVLNTLSVEQGNKLNKQIADKEARIAGLEKKIRKIGQKYKVDIDLYI
jgi:hypothetical protein